MAINIIGDRYGRLIVLSLHSNISYRKKFNCICDCGNNHIVRMSHLRTGHTVSCGCRGAETRDQTTHGESNTKLYKRYMAMRERCHSPKSHGYHKYGAKGITVCKEWRYNFLAFKKWAMSNGYSKGLSIDRKDNNKGYSPGNCRWVNASTQAINQGKSTRNKSGYKYICWAASNDKWVAKVTVKGERKHIGYFTELLDAREAVINYLTKHKLKEQLRTCYYE